MYSGTSHYKPRGVGAGSGYNGEASSGYTPSSQQITGIGMSKGTSSGTGY